MNEAAPSSAPPRAKLILTVLMATALVVTALYVRTSSGGKETTADCALSNAALARVAPLEIGAVAAAHSSSSASLFPNIDFFSPDGRPISLAALRGRVVLLNLWATWCAPCRAEMPTLDQLQAALGSKDFEVVAVNVDTTRLEQPRNFFRDRHIEKLALYADPQADSLFRLKTAGKVVGLPTTTLIGRDGCEIARLAGPADWASPDALAMIKAAL